MSQPGSRRNTPAQAAPRRRQGLGAVDAERFDVAAAVGGWQGVVESVAPTLVFISVLVVRPGNLVVALAASLSISVIGLIARLVARQGLTQVIGGAVGHRPQDSRDACAPPDLDLADGHGRVPLGVAGLVLSVDLLSAGAQAVTQAP